MTGEVTWYASSGAARRGFCGVCGSSLFWDGPGANLSIFAGTLDGAPALELAGHIFCADKGCYYEIADGLPQAEQDDPGLTTVIPLISGNLESSASHRRSLDSPELGVKRRGNDDGGDARE